MSVKLYLATLFGFAMLAGSAIVPNGATAAISDNSASSRQHSSSALMNPEYLQLARRGGGGSSRSRGASRPSGGAARRPGGGTAKRPSGSGKAKPNKNVNRNVNRNVNVNVRTRGRGWRGARWGAVAFGVTMGAIIIVAANTPPYPPDDSLCWTWSNASLTKGYWYYCSGP
jgi:hypothetical protein